MNPKSRGAPRPTYTLIPSLCLSSLFLRHSWSYGCYGDRMHFGIGGGVSICRHVPSPSTSSWSLFFRLAPLNPQISPHLRYPPPSYPAKLHVCPIPWEHFPSSLWDSWVQVVAPALYCVGVGVGEVGKGAGSWGKKHVQAPWGDKGSWERDFRVLHFPTSASLVLAVTRNLLCFRRRLSTHRLIFSFVPKCHIQ